MAALMTASIGMTAMAAAEGDITVVSREDGSGTRGAFIELFGVEEKDADGNKVDNTTEAAKYHEQHCRNARNRREGCQCDRIYLPWISE